MSKQINIYLGKSQRDQIIAAWVDSISDDPNVNLSEIVKNHLYAVATGQAGDSTAESVISAMMPELQRLRELLSRGVLVAGTADNAEPDDAEEIKRILGMMPD